MKKIILTALLLFLISATAYANELKIKPDQVLGLFGGSSISHVEYDGKTYVGICADKIATSTDFQNWTIYSKLPTVYVTTRLNNEFVAIGEGITLKSKDGVIWQEHKNNIQARIWDFAKNSRAILAFARNFSNDSATGTFVSTDGVKWTRIKNIPDGGKMSVVNDHFVIESTEYMRGVYISEKGEEFTRLDTKGLNLAYYDNAYHTLEASEKNYLWRSKDLKEWSTREVGEYVYPYNPLILKLDQGKEYAFNTNGNIMIFENDKWRYTGKTISIRGNSYPPVVKYNLTDQGLFAWSNHFMTSYMPKPISEVITYNRENMVFPYPRYTENGALYLTVGSENFSLYKSTDGINWHNTKEPIDDGYLKLFLNASNGTTTLKTEHLQVYEGKVNSRNANTAVLTDKDGKTSIIAYENEHDMLIFLQGGDGFYLIGPPGNASYSPDGITRYKGRLGLINPKVMINVEDNGMLSVTNISKLKELELPPRVKVKLNGIYLSFVNPPFVENKQAYFPLKFLLERIGGEVHGVIIYYKDNGYLIMFHENIIIFDNKEIKVNSFPKKLEKEIYVTPSFLEELFGLLTKYDEKTNTVEVYTKPL